MILQKFSPISLLHGFQRRYWAKRQLTRARFCLSSRVVWFRMAKWMEQKCVSIGEIHLLLQPLTWTMKTWRFKRKPKIICKTASSLLSRVIFLSWSSSLIKEVNEMILKTTSIIHRKTSNDIFINNSRIVFEYFLFKLMAWARHQIVNSCWRRKNISVLHDVSYSRQQ